MGSDPSPGRLLAQARMRAGLSQRALAQAAETTQSVVARIESGATNPGWTTLARLLHATGFELHGALIPRPRLDDEARAEMERLRALSPQGRLAGATFDAARALRTLDRHRVRSVLAGTAAARIHGLPRPAPWLDLVPAADGANLVGLAGALRELDARVWVDGVPTGLAFDCTARTLSRAERWGLVTTAGRVSLDFRPAGTEGCEDLARGALRVEAWGVRLLVASAGDLIRSMGASCHPLDRENALWMEALAHLR